LHFFFFLKSRHSLLYTASPAHIMMDGSFFLYNCNLKVDYFNEKISVEVKFGQRSLIKAPWA
jgi:hypothetical protein